jgi:glycosyltransferase involved in cell wall biosynthesis
VSVAIVHDYLTQRGGAERVVLSMLKAFPGAPLYTSFYDPEGTFPDFAGADIRTLPIDVIRPLRKHHRLALPLLAPVFSRCKLSADVVLCSSSGWAHGVAVEGRKVVYCNSPARWLYQSSRYLGEGHAVAGYALRAMRPYLLGWDRRAARSAASYLTSSTAVAERILAAYGIEAIVLPPPHAVDPGGAVKSVTGLQPGFLLCVSRLLPYKNVGPTIEAFRGLKDHRLVVVGTGPERRRLAEEAPPNVRLLGSVSDEELRWLYTWSAGLVAASYEDYGLTPLEAAAFGKPSAVLRWGGFLDTLIEGEIGVFFDTPEPMAIASAVRAMGQANFCPQTLQAHAARYSEDQFTTRLRSAVLGAGAAPASVTASMGSGKAGESDE